MINACLFFRRFNVRSRLARHSRWAISRPPVLHSIISLCIFTLLIIALTSLLAGCGDNTASLSSGATGYGSTNSSAANPANAAPVSSTGRQFSPDASRPDRPVRLIFIHHSVGEDWLDDTKGGLGKALADNNYFVSDTSYGWGPPDADAGSENIGDHTDTGYWYSWFAGPNSSTYLSALYDESGQHSNSPYQRLSSNPGGENEIVMLKSCFPNSNLGGSPGDPPAQGQNLLRGQPAGEEVQTVQNAKGIYNDLLGYFATRQDKLFVVVTAPPLIESETTPEAAANTRAFNAWLVNDWLKNYPHKNVAVFDFYNVLTSNGGSPTVNDSGKSSGNHHRYVEATNTVEYVNNQGGNFSAYGSEDSHPTSAGEQKATEEFTGLLNLYYHTWKNG